MDFSKTERRTLRELAGSVYEAEAHRMLEALDADFGRWRKGEMPNADLLDAIHRFHQHESRELWSMYQSLRDPDIVARGIVLGLMAESAVPAELLEKLAPLRELYGQAINRDRS